MTQADNSTSTSSEHSDSRIKDGLESARTTASQATARASETIETSPLAMLAGGLAIGAIAGALIPRSEREKELLRPVGTKLGATAAAAIAAAKEAGRNEIDSRGLTVDAARDHAKSLLSSVGQAATNAATAAAKSAKEEATGAAAQADSTGGTGDSVPPIDPHHQVVPGDRETSVSPTA